MPPAGRGAEIALVGAILDGGDWGAARADLGAIEPGVRDGVWYRWQGHVGAASPCADPEDIDAASEARSVK